MCCLQARVDVLKMDIEFSEWSALEDMLDKGHLLHVRQLLVEFHMLHEDDASKFR